MERPGYASFFPTNPNPNPTFSPPELIYRPPSASAPPLTADYPRYSLNYPHNPDPLAATAPQQPISSSYAFDQPPTLPPSSSPAYGLQYYGSYDNSYPSSLKFGGSSDYVRSDPDLASNSYWKRPDGSSRFANNDGGVYAHEGKVEPCGTAPNSSTWLGFDDYGRPINFPSENVSHSTTSSSGQITKVIPRAETRHDVKDGVVKFRVKMQLPELGGDSVMDVLCQIGLDGIIMLDPSNSRKLRIYSLDAISGCEVMDSRTVAFWVKNSVDVEPRCIRLQSNSYTTNTLLDTITAAIVQFNEIGGRNQPSEFMKTTEQFAEKKKGFTDWINLIKPGNEEKDHWVPDEAVSKCTGCGTDFGAFIRKHHCRNCGDIFCDKCTSSRAALRADQNALPVRVCEECMGEVTHRLSNAKYDVEKPFVQSHGDLAMKLQEEMGKNRRTLSGSNSKSEISGAGRRTEEVACPICTVRLQVQVPNSGSETVECGVCQHPFLVSAY